MMHRTRPKDFNPKFEVVSCFCEFNGKILLLQRLPNKPEGNTWGVPAGKKSADETVLDAILREVNEETGLNIPDIEVKYSHEVYVRFAAYDFIYHMSSAAFHSQPDVKINVQEHSQFTWVTPEEALKMDLIEDEDACIKLQYGIA